MGSQGIFVMLLIAMRNRITLRTDPCGSPLDVAVDLDWMLANLTLRVLLDRKL